MVVVTPLAGKGTLVAKAFQALAGVKALYTNDNGLRVKANGAIPTLAPGEPGKGFDVVDEPTDVVAAPPADRPYGIDLVGAPAAWAQGADGHGLVYGSIDTGVDVTHESLANYRGRGADGALVHDYNFYDPTGKAKAAVDTQAHGSHTIGTAVGQNGIGVAPKATYISALGLSGNVDSTLRALQWMLAPTKVDGSAPDPTRAPDVVGMSWWTGSASEDLFQESMQDLRAAGIEPVKSAGNNGPGGKSISSPGQFPELIATAAVDAKGNVASFSSRGPAPFPAGSTTPKPDFAAPGVDVISSMPGNKYGKMSGTSMAQPHMSGVILAILSQFPQLTHDQLVDVLKAGAADKGAAGWDVEYGNGVVNLPASLAAAQRLVDSLAA
ncbi:MAG: serine protease [Thermoleophilia bacterium]|nr:serine protease [Thermoleophilia bacterium]